MTVVETAAEEVLVGLEQAERRQESIRLRRVTEVGIIALIVSVQIGWVAGCAYAAYLFLL
jgi:hypothetical protein